MSQSTTNPYVGPRTFEEEDAPFFYGRERESRDLLSFVMSEPLVLFYAQSGAGKSSLINTSLIPNLRQEGFQVLPVGRVGGNLPESITDARNIFTFNLLANLEKDTNPVQFTQMMLIEYLAQSRNQNGQRQRVLIIDQFEEIVTHHPGRWQDREDFFWQLQAAMQHDPLLWVLLTMREDHIAALEPYSELLPGELQARFYMQRLKLNAAQAAVEKPATQAGKPFVQGVAKELVRNLSLIRDAENRDGLQRYGEYVEPVQLQVVCYQLWENLKERLVNRITDQHVQALGNVDKALADFYNMTITQVVYESKVSEITLRNWFERKLITEAHTRGTVYQGQDTTDGLPNEAVNLLADKFLLRAERRAGGVWYELVHDRFVDPILQANNSWLDEKGLLVRAAIAWDESGRSSSKLYLGNQLKDTLNNVEWRSLEPVVMEFLRECGRANQELSEREKAQRRELEQAKQLAEIQVKSTQMLRLYLIIVGVFLLIAISTSISATKKSAENSEQATKSAKVAATSNAVADTSNIRATNAALLAATLESEKATSVALAVANKAQADTNEALAATAARALRESQILSAEVSELNEQNAQNEAIVATISANSTKNVQAAQTQAALSTISTERISFDPGAIYGDASGSLEPNNQKRYVLRALPGQTMTVSFLSRSGNYVIRIQGENRNSLDELCEIAGEHNDCSVVLPANQDYIVTITSLDGGSYTVRVTIV